MANKTTETDFTLQQDSYASFDALTLKQLMKQRLNDGGVYTDQTFEGSNMSSIIDVIAFSYHTLLFYLNRTSAETMFTDATIYENMNRIVKLVDYKPKGYQTSLLPFNVDVNSSLSIGTYTIKRYSYFSIDGTIYSFANDITFTKSLPGDESLVDFSDTNLLRQGQYFEYPPQFSTGEDFETIVLSLKVANTNTNLKIDGGSIDVYVKDANTGKYVNYTETNNMFLESPESPKYEKRLNENGLFEIKFGNGVFGKNLNEGDEVSIFYITSDGEGGIVSRGQLDGRTLNFFITPKFTDISNSIYDDTFTFLLPSQVSTLAFTNTVDSSNPKDIESVDEIRINATKNLQLQNRVVTVADFKSDIEVNYSNVIKSVNVVNNKTYINEYIKYFYDIGLNKPNDDSRLLFNQVKFATSSQLNNVFLFMVPKFLSVDEDNNFYYVSTPQKSSIVNSLADKKLLNVEILPQDPIYTAFGLGLSIGGDNELTSGIIDQTQLVIKRDVLTNVSAENLKQRVNNIFKNYFETLELGSLFSINDLLVEIFSLPGVINVFTRRTVNGESYEIPNISMLVFNPIYEQNDIRTITGDYQLPFFKFPFLYNKSILNKIIVENV
tara:strand:- start:9964 stop:11787 length:1824 start_codon:yes stop_codon:yes gene_type:complete